MPLLIRRLVKADRRDHFDCGDSRLNDYLRFHALQNQERHQVGTTYVAVELTAPLIVVGYYTLSVSEVPTDHLPRHLGPYPRLPVILLARLAVDNRAARRGIGEQLLVNALERSVSLSRQVGCRGVLVEAYPSAVEFYRKYGFIEIGTADTVNTRRMFIDLRTVARAQIRSLPGDTGIVL